MKTVLQILPAIKNLNCRVKTLETTAATVTSGAPVTFAQAAPSGTWSLTHAFAYPPNVYVIDSSGNMVYPDVHYVDATHITITCTPPISGTAYMS